MAKTMHQRWEDFLDLFRDHPTIAKGAVVVIPVGHLLSADDPVPVRVPPDAEVIHRAPKVRKRDKKSKHAKKPKRRR